MPVENILNVILVLSIDSSQQLYFLDISGVIEIGGKIWVPELSPDIILNEIMKRFKINAGDLREPFLGAEEYV